MAFLNYMSKYPTIFQEKKTPDPFSIVNLLEISFFQVWFILFIQTFLSYIVTFDLISHSPRCLPDLAGFYWWKIINSARGRVIERLSWKTLFSDSIVLALKYLM